MPTPQELEAALWKGIDSDRTVMLGLADGDDPMRPMTALRDGDDRTLWIFTAADTALVQQLGQRAAPARMCYAGKGHDLFACIEGSLKVDTDPAMVNRLWNRFVAAWYEGGKTDPKLRLLRFAPDHAHIWENDSSLLAGVKLLLGVDPKERYRDKKAEVDLP